MFERFTDRARRVAVLAQEEARGLNHNYIGTEHVLLGLVNVQAGEGVAVKALGSLGISLELIREQVEEIIGRGQQAPSGQIPWTPRAKTVLELSLREALELGHNYIGTEHILLGLIREGEGVAAQVLVRLGADLNPVRSKVIELLHGHERSEAAAAAMASPRKSRPTGILPFRDLTADARRGSASPVIGREREVGELVEILERGMPGHVFLVGERGAGISAVAGGLAQAIVGPGAAPSLGWMRVLEVDLTPLELGDPGGRGLTSLSGRLRELRDTVVFIERSCIPVPPGPQPVVAQLAQTLEECEAKVVAAATPGEVAEAFAAEDRLHELFRAVEVPGLSPELTERVLGEIRDRYEGQHRVEITDAAIAAAVALSGEYVPGRPLPGRAISLLDRTAADVARRSSAGVASTDIAVKGRNLPVYRVVAVTEADVAAVAASAANRS